MNGTSTLLLTALAALTFQAAPLHASCPSSQAGRMQSDIKEMGTSAERDYFEWYAFFGEHQLDATSTLSIDFAIIPFSTDITYVGLDEIGGRTFFGLEFKDGMVNGAVPYDPMGWNDVRTVISTADQSFVLTVNGISSAPIPLIPFSTSPLTATSVQALRVHRFNGQTQSEGWIDELSITRSGDGGTSTLFSATFDDAPIPFDGMGSLLADTPPATIHRPATCPSKLVSEAPSGEDAMVLSSGPAYPTPARTTVTIPYTLASDGSARLLVRDAVGSLVYEADLGSLNEGAHRAVWNCRTSSGAVPPPGSYFYTIEAGEGHLTGKIQLVR